MDLLDIFLFEPSEKGKVTNFYQMIFFQKSLENFELEISIKVYIVKFERICIEIQIQLLDSQDLI